MKKDKTTKGKHLTREDRDYIEAALNQGWPLSEIAKKLEKDPTTISKEIKRNRIASSRNKQSDTEIISCNNKKDCTRKHICHTSCDRLCKKCKTLNCYRICLEYIPMKCIHLSRFPHVCNGCKRTMVCHVMKQYYRAKVADANYHEILKSAREGADITSGELIKLDSLISPLILKGQPLAHIFANHKEEIGRSERTLYNYFDRNMFAARNIDLPRKVKFKPRKKRSTPSTRPQLHRLERTYNDLKTYIASNSDVPIVEMDTVHGTNTGKVVLTLHFRNSSLMLGLLLDECSIECANAAIDKLYEDLGPMMFKKTFPILLTDNGSEFKAPEGMECDHNGNERTKVFFCDPMASYQKPYIEKNHEYLRYIFPKGKSLNKFSQEDLTLAINHVNSTARASLNGSTPYKLARLLLGKSVLEKLSMKEIPADEVHLKPALLKK
jgi:transposase, IS30 family